MAPPSTHTNYTKVLRRGIWIHKDDYISDIVGSWLQLSQSRAAPAEDELQLLTKGWNVTFISADILGDTRFSALFQQLKQCHSLLKH